MTMTSKMEIRRGEQTAQITKIIEARDARGTSIKDLAEALGITKPTIARILLEMTGKGILTYTKVGNTRLYTRRKEEE